MLLRANLAGTHAMLPQLSISQGHVKIIQLSIALATGMLAAPARAANDDTRF
jgi:hypothetical protein